MGADGLVQAAELLLLDEASLNQLSADPMNPEAQKLYNLLPALYRVRDAEQGEPLKALCAVIAEEIAVLRENLEQLYDDQFIETCAEWVAPYIGDLIGYRPIHGVTLRTLSARAEVANTIAYRRRKGTATMLEQLARDVTGWTRARRGVFPVARNQPVHEPHPSIKSPRPPTCAIGRRWSGGTLRSTRMAHSVDTRHIEVQKGRYNIPNIGLFLWRLGRISADRLAGVSHRRQALPVQPVGKQSPTLHAPPE